MSDALFYKAAYLIHDHADFDSWAYKGVGHKVAISDLGTVTLIERQKDEQWELLSNSYYGEAPQGYEGEIGLVFRVETPDGQEIFLKKRGTKDSYGSESWDDKIVRVAQTTKTVTVFAEV